MKRIVICADGTWNRRDQVDKVTNRRRPTNVTKVARAVLPRANDIDQVVFYHEGLGTGGAADRLTGGAFGDGIEKNVQELYRSIMYNYVSGDELFFFGFSRGAFTVRTLAGLMNAIGLLYKEDDYWLPEMYSCYEQGKLRGSPEWQKAIQGFEKETRPCPPISFIGVWDTVGALGPPGMLGHFLRPQRYEYHDVNLNVNILNAYQALAIDEHRKPFAPSVWERPPAWTGKLEQAWFAGVHSDVGGSQSRDGLANEALHWLVEKAESLGLVFDSDFLLHYTPCFNGDIHDSMSTMYRVLGPVTRDIGGRGENGERPHRAALDRKELKSCAYIPPNLASYLAQNASVEPYETTRIVRGTPC